MKSFDYKKEYKELYLPKTTPSIITVPKMKFLAVQGYGNPNEVGGQYQQSIQKLYPIAYALKMSQKNNYVIDGFFDYVVPPLEGFWWQEGVKGVDITSKETFQWISIIRLPDFITLNDFDWAKEVTSKKKKDIDFSNVELMTYDEGLCVQCMHLGSFDNEIETVSKMHEYIESLGYVLDISDKRFHHEIYLSDPRKGDSKKFKTVIRHPIKLK